jgi:hypothetical protein
MTGGKTALHYGRKEVPVDGEQKIPFSTAAPSCHPGSHHRPFRYCELFAGIGGFRIALDALGGQCVFASEIDQGAAETYQNNFGERPFGDITAIEWFAPLCHHSCKLRLLIS